MRAGFSLPGYRLLRPISDREHSKLFLGRDEENGALLCVKLEFPRDPEKSETILARYAKLQTITAHAGFAQIIEFGRLDSGWIWHCMPLADNLPGLPAVASEKGVLEYTPLTLAAWTIENGRASAGQTAEWGLRICSALRVLHGAGLVHRDVKPSNLLFIAGELCLADYGLLGEPGSEHDFSGTEGFIPLEGTLDAGADLFALGKTLYHVWSGKDRLEYPSLPVSATEGEDWKRHGSILNAVILRACHAQPSRRFHSAEEFSRDLADVVAGKTRSTRRGWLSALGLAGAAGAFTWMVLRRRAAPRAFWRRAGPEFNVEAWQGHFGTADWTRGRLFSLCRQFTEFWFHTVDLKTFAIGTKQLEPLPKDFVFSFLHPRSRKLLAVEGGFGEVFEVDVDSNKVRSLGGGPARKTSFSPSLYWNPVTGRLGTFGGYGYFKVHNARHEFDEVSGQWIEMRQGGKLPWPRQHGLPLLPGPDPARLFLVGGLGSPSGEQGKEVPGLRGFNAQFHFLDDIWELDLRSNQWTEVLPIGRFPFVLESGRDTSAFFHPRLQGIVLFSSPALGGVEQQRVTGWLVRPGIDREPHEIIQEGEVSRLGRAWAYALDPNTDELLFFAPDGIFRIAFRVSEA